MGCLCFPWLPYYLFIVFGLGLDGDWSAGGRDGAGTEPGLGLALAIAAFAAEIQRPRTWAFAASLVALGLACAVKFSSAPLVTISS